LKFSVKKIIPFVLWSKTENEIFIFSNKKLVFKL